MYDGELPWNLRAHVALTYLDAEFTRQLHHRRAAAAGAGGIEAAGRPVEAGVRRAGVDARAVTAASMRRSRSSTSASSTSTIATPTSAPAYTVTNVRVGLAQTVGACALREFVRVNNVFDRKYAGSVIVGDTNGRFFEPAPPRNWFVGVNVDVPL